MAKQINPVDVDFKNALPFTEEEFELIKNIDKKYYKFINRLNYYGKNFIYIYEETPQYFAYMFDVYKFPEYYIIDNVNGLGTKYRYDNIQKLTQALEKY